MYFEIRFIVIYFSPFFLLRKNINEEEPLCLNLLPFLSKIIMVFFFFVCVKRKNYRANGFDFALGGL